jgi:hypothetical protein
MTLSDVGTIVLSLVAVVISALSAYVATRQASLQDRANNAIGVIQILSELRSPELRNSFDRMYEGLPRQNAEEGLSGLPEDLKTHTLNVCYFLNQVGSMMVLGVIREDAFLAMFRARAIAAWEAVGPFVHREREINPRVGAEYLSVIEALATKASRLGPRVGREILAEWLDKQADHPRPEFHLGGRTPMSRPRSPARRQDGSRRSLGDEV